MDLNKSKVDLNSRAYAGENYAVVGNESSNNGTADEVSQNDSVYYMIALALSWTNALLITSLNSAVIVTILRYKKRSRLYFLLLNLAIADLLTGITDAVPHSIERSIGLPYFQMLWVFGEAACKIQRTVANMPMTASNYILAVTAFDRAMVICKPMAYFKRGSCLQKLVVVCCWLFSFLVSAPYFKLMTVTTKRHTDGLCSCNMDWGDGDWNYMWKVLLIAMFSYVFAIPFIVIVVSFAILLVSIYRRPLTPQCSNKSQTPMTGPVVFNRGLPRSKLKSIKLTCGIVLGFFISWMVFFVFMFVHVFTGYRHQFLLIVMTFYYWSSVANPIMFFIFHRRRYSTTIVTKYSSSKLKNTCSSEHQLSTKAVKENDHYPFHHPKYEVHVGTKV